MRHSRPTQGQRNEAHFNLQTNMAKEASCSQPVPQEPSNNQTLQLPEDPMSMENMIVEFVSHDLFGDLI